MRQTLHITAFTILSMLSFGACGSPTPDATEHEAERAASERSDAASSTLDSNGFVNAFSFRSTGGVESSWQGESVTMTGGCVPSEPMSIGFHEGIPTSEDYFHVAFDGLDPVGTGQTGTFDIKEIRWDHGAILHTLAGGMEVRIPNRFTGSGSIEITRHDAEVGNRRLTGIVTGMASNEEGVSANVIVEFDINLSCGVSM